MSSFGFLVLASTQKFNQRAEAAVSYLSALYRHALLGRTLQCPTRYLENGQREEQEERQHAHRLQVKDQGACVGPAPRLGCLGCELSEDGIPASCCRCPVIGGVGCIEFVWLTCGSRCDIELGDIALACSKLLEATLLKDPAATTDDNDLVGVAEMLSCAESVDATSTFTFIRYAAYRCGWPGPRRGSPREGDLL